MMDDRPVKPEGPEKDSGLFVIVSKSFPTTPSSSGATQIPPDAELTEICKILYNLQIRADNGVLRWGQIMENSKLDNSKLLDVIASYEAQAASLQAEATEALRIAADLRKIIDGPGVRVRLTPRNRPAEPAARAKYPIGNLHPDGVLAIAIGVLADAEIPVGISDLTVAVSKHKGADTPRSSIESVLSTAVKDGKYGVMRTAPGTYTVKR